MNFISSARADERIALSTVLVNEAHIIALARCGAVSRTAAYKILSALRRLEKHPPANREAEDVHVLIEEYVTKRTGHVVGGVLHLGKSRNDQVATAIRMTLRTEILDLTQTLLNFELALISLAKKHVDTVFPGYTHLQPAQPISFGHYLLANCFAFVRDSERLNETYARINLSPMGGGALAGTSFALDRYLIARLLGFDGIVETALDAVGMRDFALEVLAILALVATDLSRISSDLLFYTTSEAGLLEIPDEYASTSSIMPQKKNADPVELVRAKCAKITGNFNSAGMLLHGLTSGYNLDYQELTPILWQSLDELKSCVNIITGLLPKMTVDNAVAKRKYLEFTAATEIANVIVREQHLPFRTAHKRVGALIRTTLRKGKTLSDLKQAEWQRALGCPVRERTFRLIVRTLDLNRHLGTYRTSGSPNPSETRRLIAVALARCRKLNRKTAVAQAKLGRSERQLHNAAR
jgi:argininosuccinate lyase